MPSPSTTEPLALASTSEESASTATKPLVLTPAEGEVLAIEAARFAQSVRDPSLSARYERLATDARSGAVPEELISSLETMLELVFEKGRPTNRAVLQSIYARTPRGRQLASTAREVNRALESLRGQTISAIRLSAAQSTHSIVIETDRCRLTLELDRAGVRVTTLEGG